jgi:hypothetical protein
LPASYFRKGEIIFPENGSRVSATGFVPQRPPSLLVMERHLMDDRIVLSNMRRLLVGIGLSRHPGDVLTPGTPPMFGQTGIDLKGAANPEQHVLFVVKAINLIGT